MASCASSFFTFSLQPNIFVKLKVVKQFCCFFVFFSTLLFYAKRYGPTTDDITEIVCVLFFSLTQHFPTVRCIELHFNSFYTGIYRTNERFKSYTPQKICWSSKSHSKQRNIKQLTISFWQLNVFRYFLVGNQHFYLHNLPARKWIEWQSDGAEGMGRSEVYCYFLFFFSIKFHRSICSPPTVTLIWIYEYLIWALK